MSLQTLRKEIDQINHELIRLLGKRLKLAKEIAKVKKQEHLPVLDSNREAAIREEIRSLAKEHGLSPSIIEDIFQLILDYTKVEMEAL